MTQISQSYPIPEPDGNPALPSIALLTERQWEYLRNRYQMTTREFEIAQLVCRGLSNEQVAEKLQICGGTVKTHIRNLYRKTLVHNKISMLLRFMEDAAGNG